jgi:hypothetical protein
MNLDASEVTLNGVAYVPKSAVNQKAESVDGMDYVIVRTYAAGVFAGYLKSRNGKEVELVKARRFWCWYGAASLSQLAVDGTNRPNDCKFPCEVPTVTLLEAVEILPVSAKAQKSIAEVKVWQA